MSVRGRPERTRDILRARAPPGGERPRPQYPGAKCVVARNGTLVNEFAPECLDTKDCLLMDLLVFLPLLIIMGAFMFFASRRQKKAMQATIDLHNSLQVGDRIHTTSGLQGTITGIGEDYVDLEIAPGVVTTWMKLAVRDRITDDDTDAEDEYDDLEDSGDELGARSSGTEISDRPNTKE